MSRRACWSAVLLLLLAACSPAPVEDVRSAIVDGTVAPEDAAVGALVARRARCVEPEPALLCTVTLIAPRVVLTAAHCLDTFGADGQYEVLFDDALRTSSMAFVVIGVRAHPGYDPRTHENDLALMLLAAPVPGIVPVPLATTSVAAGDTVRAVGFGTTRDAAQPAGIRRSGTMVVSALSTSAFQTTRAPAMTCTGDSGGPVFTVGSPQTLAGVTASGDPGCTTEAFNVRVDTQRDTFVGPFLAEAEQAPSISPPRAAELAPLCARTCARTEDCPAALSCVKDETGAGQCLSLALREGAYLESCASDDQCGGATCARVWTTGADACRCFVPCPPAPKFGCTTAPGAPLGLWLVVLAGRHFVRRRRDRIRYTLRGSKELRRSRRA